MAPKLEELLGNAIAGLRKRDKPLPIRPKRPEHLTSFLPPPSGHSSPEWWGSGPWSPSLPSPEASPLLRAPPATPEPSPPIVAFSNAWSKVPSPPSTPPYPLASLSAQTPPLTGPSVISPPASLIQRRYKKQPPLISKSVEDKIARLELEVASLRQANKVLYKQNSDYRGLVEEYRTCQENTSDVMKHIIGAVKDLEEIAQDIRVDVKTYRLTKADARKAEDEAVKDWRKFVNANAKAGVEVDQVMDDIKQEHMNITVFPYQRDRNMI